MIPRKRENDKTLDVVVADVRCTYGGVRLLEASFNHIEIWQNEMLFAVTINDEINISGISQMKLLIKDGKLNIDLSVKEPVDKPAV